MITQAELKENLYYNPKTGDFTRLASHSNRTKVGDIAGTLDCYGYSVVMVKGSIYKAHRLAWFIIYGAWPKDQIDHINHNKSDNRIVNLREADSRENHRNCPMQKNNISGCCGVSWVKRDKVWRAQIKIDGTIISLGSYTDKFEAICARKSADNKYGFHENHGATK